MEPNKLLSLPLYYDEGSQMILDQKGIVLDVRMWGRITGTGGFNLPVAEGMKVQDDFGKLIADTLNDRFAPTSKVEPSEQSPSENSYLKLGSCAPAPTTWNGEGWGTNTATRMPYSSIVTDVLGNQYEYKDGKAVKISPSGASEQKGGEPEVVKFIRLELKPEYENDVFTFGAIKRALWDYQSTEDFNSGMIFQELKNPSVVTQSEKGEEIFHRFVMYEWNDYSPAFKQSFIEAVEGYAQSERSRAIDECLKIAESISFDTEDQAGIKFVAVVLDELKEKLKSRQ